MGVPSHNCYWEGLEGELALETQVANWRLVECQGHVALSPWVPGRTLVGSDGEAGGTDQTWRLCSLMGCLRWGVAPFEEVYLNANPWTVQVIIQFEGRLS